MNQSSGDSEAVVTVERIGGVALLTLNRPKAMNAVNAELSQALGDALDMVNRDEALRAAVITGAGRAFCAGADLKEIAAGRSILAPTHPEWGFAGLVQHYIDKPTIAAVNGHALGGGTEMVLACDLAVLSEQAKLGLPEVKRGLVAAAGGLFRLPRQVPLKRALEIALTGEPVTPQQAEAWGVVNRVVAPEQVLETALRLAEQVSQNAPLALRASKRIVHHSASYGSDWQSPIWEFNRVECKAVFQSEDAVEGPTAFAEKRAPCWRGR